MGESPHGALFLVVKRWPNSPLHHYFTILVLAFVFSILQMMDNQQIAGQCEFHG